MDNPYKPTASDQQQDEELDSVGEESQCETHFKVHYGSKFSRTAFRLHGPGELNIYTNAFQFSGTGTWHLATRILAVFGIVILINMFLKDVMNSVAFLSFPLAILVVFLTSKSRLGFPIHDTEAKNVKCEGKEVRFTFQDPQNKKLVKVMVTVNDAETAKSLYRSLKLMKVH